MLNLITYSISLFVGKWKTTYPQEFVSETKSKIPALRGDF